MNNKLKILAAASCIALFGAVGNAATVIYEGGGPGVKPGSPAADQVLGDFGTSTGSPVLMITGDTSLYGGIAHTSASNFKDGWTMDFGTSLYDVVFNYEATTQSNGSGLFNGTLTVGGGTPIVLSGAGTVNLGVLTGAVTFLIDATAGGEPREQAFWDVQATQVPLPAGALLMLTGLGGIALVRRRKNA